MAGQADPQAANSGDGENLPGPRFPKIEVPDISGFPQLPVVKWPDAVLGGKAGGYPEDIRVIYNVGSNLLNQGSDIKKSIRAFQKVDFAVSHDYFMTPTAIFSDIVLPATTFLEREDVVYPADNYLFYNSRASHPLHQARDDYDILWELSEKLTFGEAFSENRTSAKWLQKFFEASEIDDIDTFKSTGIYAGKEQHRVGLAAFTHNPADNPLQTPAGKIEICTQSWSLSDFSATPQTGSDSPCSNYPMRLITPHSKYRINSQNSNLPWVQSLAPPVLEMNALDAQSRKIQDGNRVCITSNEGRMEIKVSLSEEIIRGTVCLYQGFWTRRNEKGTEVNGAANILTSTTPTQPSLGSRTHSVFVNVEKISKPMIRARKNKNGITGTRIPDQSHRRRTDYPH